MSEIVNIVGASSLLWPVCWLINKYQKGNSVKKQAKRQIKITEHFKKQRGKNECIQFI